MLFGLANGLGYGFVLQISNQSSLENKGFVMGLVAASYALGSVISPWPLTFVLNIFGLMWAMLSLILALLVIMPIVSGLLYLSQAQLHISAPEHKNSLRVGQHVIFSFG